MRVIMLTGQGNVGGNVPKVAPPQLGPKWHQMVFSQFARRNFGLEPGEKYNPGCNWLISLRCRSVSEPWVVKRFGCEPGATIQAGLYHRNFGQVTFSEQALVGKALELPRFRASSAQS
jgi:hypothetical protein